MRRAHSSRLLVGAAALAAAGALHCSPHAADPVRALLDSHPGLQGLVEGAEEHRLQVVLGTVEASEEGRPVLVQHGFRAGAEYFYPASSVKLFAAVAALERLAELSVETGLGIDAQTPLVYHPLFDGETLEDRDESHIAGGSITVAHEIRKLFLVSDNEAFNRLYELVGQDRLARSLRRAGLGEARIVHRLAEARSAEESRRFPRIDLLVNGGRHTLEDRLAEPLSPAPELAGLTIGRAHVANGTTVPEAMDFSTKNRIALADLQRGLCMVVRPDVDCGGPGFRLTGADRSLLLTAMSELPRDSLDPKYDPTHYPDDYVKFLLPGLERVSPGTFTVYNKVGLAYGFTVENAWVVDRESGRSFFLAATVYTNENGVLNDDRYEYDEVALPFMADLGEAAARSLR